jgi:DNA repair exonuclease SbcCD ATPase subunit
MFRVNVETIEKYKNYKIELEKYTEARNKVETLKENEELKRNRYSAATLLRDKILQAESIAITNIINSINIHAQEYLDLFFPNDPIVVRLSAFKECKKRNVSAKPQINMEIDYKGMEADISMLSGGELARVVLAFTLSLAEIFNSPILLLDECTASLDQETTSIVMEGIRKNFSQKLVISIAHQVVSGDFDRQINL